MHTSPAWKLVKILVSLAVTALLILTVVVTSARGEQVDAIVGKPTVIDPVSLRINGARVRLYGIVPASRLELLPVEAVTVLVVLMRHSPTVACTPRSIHTDGSAIAVCLTEDGRDLGASLVGAGYSRSDPALRVYHDAEARARAIGLGIWPRRK